MRHAFRSIPISVLTVTAALALSACGIKGELKTPPPIFNQDKLAKPLPKAPVEGQPSSSNQKP